MNSNPKSIFLAYMKANKQCIHKLVYRFEQYVSITKFDCKLCQLSQVVSKFRNLLASIFPLLESNLLIKLIDIA